MKYFDTLPKIVGSDNNNNAVILTNLMARASIVSDLATNPLLYYTYDIQDGDTPEIVAHKYYGDSYRYWIVLMANQIMDPQWEWPMSGSVLSQYLSQKYGSVDIYSTKHHFEKIITHYDINTGTSTINIVNITEDEYNTMVTGLQSYTLPTGVVEVTTNRRAVTIFDYEMERNENKRQIKLLNKTYVNQFEDDFKKLMK